MKFSHFKAILLTTGAVMGAIPTAAALAPASVYAEQADVSGVGATNEVFSVAAANAQVKSGFVKEGNTWVLYKNGKLSNETTIVNGTINGKNGWYYIKNGKAVSNYTGFAKNSFGWWYVENGQVTFKKSEVTHGSVNGQNAWWNVKNSKVIFNKSIEPNKFGWWYIKDGKVDFGYTGIANNSLGWWYVKGGKVDFNYTGIANNSYGWWYLKNGKVDFSYNGFAKNANGTWYIKNGKVDFSKNGVVSGTVNGKNSKWNVSGGRVVSEYVSSTTSESSAGWKTGKASAYGGSTDPGCGSITANGSRVTNSSMGVAIPLAWGRRDLLGHKVDIQYNGKTVTAIINDLGGMGGGSRALDLQPGVFKYFGFNSCSAWGVRTVKYRIH